MGGSWQPQIERNCIYTKGESLLSLPKHDEDEWLEIELGSFYTNSDDEEVRMCLKEIKGVHLKGGLIVDGIEIRPKLCYN